MCPIDSENASVDLAHFDPKAVALLVGWRCIHFHFLDFYTHNPHNLILNSVTDTRGSGGGTIHSRIHTTDYPHHLIRLPVPPPPDFLSSVAEGPLLLQFFSSLLWLLPS